MIVAATVTRTSRLLPYSTVRLCMVFTLLLHALHAQLCMHNCTRFALFNLFASVRSIFLRIEGASFAIVIPCVRLVPCTRRSHLPASRNSVVWN